MNKNPDFEIEEFWLNFKKSMKNFYSKKNFSRPINYWSNQLNILQKKKEYDNIEKNIKNYISLYAIDILRSISAYDIGILKTNLKRWNSISKKYNFNDNKKYSNIIFLFLDLFDTIYETDDEYCKNLFSQIDLLIFYEDLTELIIFSIDNKKYSIIDKLNNYCNIYKTLNKIYNLDLKNNISGIKVSKSIQ
uniref:Uncharacterized protein n=1 Tax=Megaviridae environmental sample TaxID=1737588 RepID=A0A5J6VJW9_9VIRU|nr:MAG: hypothetical protein [Megaviridae environmental sample]